MVSLEAEHLQRAEEFLVRHIQNQCYPKEIKAATQGMDYFGPFAVKRGRGRIIETYKGADSLVRSARVRLRDTELVRPITKLCILEDAQETTQDNG